MIVIPPYLEKGDKIGLVAPSGFMAVDAVQPCIEMLDAWGFSVIMGETTYSQSLNYFSGTDNERRKNLQQMLDNKELRAILCVRGGYGMSRIIDQLRFHSFKKHPKWIVGFSDITLLLCHLFAKFHTASIHGPMAAAFSEGYNSPYIHSLKSVLEGQPIAYETAPHPFNKPGNATGTLIGGNLSLLTHIIGTSSEPKTKGKILLIEDVGDYLYQLDRMMIQLKRSGKLKNLSGLLVGGFFDMKDTIRPFGKPAYEIINEHVQDYDYPVAFDFPVSHGKKNFALKLGVSYQLTVEHAKVALTEVKL